MESQSLKHAAEAALHATASLAAQLAVWADGTVESAAAGQRIDGTPYGAHDLAPGYCMAKIPIAAALLALASEGEVSLQDEVARFGPIGVVAPGCTILDVLDHRAGLLTPDMVSWRMTDPARRTDPLVSRPSEPVFGYADLLPNVVLCRVIGSIVGPIGAAGFLDDLFRLAGADAGLAYGRAAPVVNPPVWVSERSLVPLASEMLEDQVGDVSPATGVFASAEGLLRLLAWVFFESPTADAALEIVRAEARPASFDVRLGRPASYAAGFMSRMGEHGIQEASPESFGHTAAISGWLAIIEPRSRQIRVGYSNGVLHGEDEGVVVRNVLNAAARGDLDRLGKAQGVPGERVKLQPCSIDAEPLGLNDLLSVLRQQRGTRVASMGANFTIALRPSSQSTEGILMVFGNEVLEEVAAGWSAAEADLSVVVDFGTALAWLADPSARLGELIAREELEFSGNPWFLSALEYWAARVSR